MFDISTIFLLDCGSRLGNGMGIFAVRVPATGLHCVYSAGIECSASTAGTHVSLCYRVPAEIPMPEFTGMPS